MPFIHIYAYEGRSTDQKRQLVQEITKATVTAFNCKPETVHIYFFDQKLSDAAHAGVLAVDEEGKR